MVDNEPMKPVIDPFKALDEDAPVLRTDKEGKTDNHIWNWSVGDKESTDKLLNSADVTVKEQMHIPRIHVASIETCGCVADYNKVENHLTMYMTTQAPHAIRTVIALVAGPVKWVEDRSENLQADSFARDYHITAEMAATKEGKIQGILSSYWQITDILMQLQILLNSHRVYSLSVQDLMTMELLISKPMLYIPTNLQEG